MVTVKEVGYSPVATLAALFIVGCLFSANIFARTEISSSIAVSENYQSNKSDQLDETGTVTTISPGFAVEYSQARLNLSLDYTFNAVINSGLSDPNHHNQELNFVTQIAHIPGKWNSQLNSQIYQTNINADGVQIVDGVTESANTEELRTLGVATRYTGKLGQAKYQAAFLANNAGFKGQDTTDNYGVDLTLNDGGGHRLGWSSTVRSNISSSQQGRNQIDSILLELDYEINHKLSTFIVADKASSGNSDLDQAGTEVGFSWVPNPRSSFRLGLGSRGGETTYSLNSALKNRRLSLIMNYSEKITTSSASALTETSSAAAVILSTQSLSIVPLLIQEGTITLTAKGQRNEISLSYLNQVKNITSLNSADERNEKLSLSAMHRLPRDSQLNFAASHQTSHVQQVNTVNDYLFSYARQWTKKLTVSANIRHTKQTSNVSANEYERNQVGVDVSVIF